MKTEKYYKAESDQCCLKKVPINMITTLYAHTVCFIFSIYVVAVLLFAVVLGDLNRFWISCLGPSVLLLPKLYLAFQSFHFERT